MGCNSCNSRGWHVDLKTRQQIVCPVCKGVVPLPQPNILPTKNGHYDYALYDSLESAIIEIRPTSYMEIGVREGMSLECVLSADKQHRIEKLLLCDSWGTAHGGNGRGNHNHISTLLERIGYNRKVEFYDGDSKKTVPRCRDKFDLILIDGDHTHSGCLTDMINSWSLLNEGGLMVIDDIWNSEYPTLGDTVKGFVSENRESAKIHTWNQAKYSGVAVLYKLNREKKIVSRPQED